MPAADYTVWWRDLHLTVSSPDGGFVRGLHDAKDPIRLDSFRVVPGRTLDPITSIEHDPTADQANVHQTADGVAVLGPTRYWTEQERLGCVLLQCFDAAYLRRDMVILHGAAIELDGRAVVLTGVSDSGKTSLAVELCRDHGAALIANDHVVVDLDGPQPMVLPGNDHAIAFRSHAVWLNDREMYHRLFGDDAQPEPYVRRRMPCADLGISVSERALPLSGIYFVGLGTVEHGTVYPTPVPRALVKLHADITGRVRASNLLLFGADGGQGPPLPNLADAEVSRHATAAVQRLVELGIVHDLRGDVDWCAKVLRAGGRS